MNELALQKLVVDAVNGAGGFAYKCNNRFLIGVADLFVKLPDKYDHSPRELRPPQQRYAGSFLEVKQAPYPNRLQAVTLDVTAPQRKFLHDASQAGVPCGVASFLQSGSGSGLRLSLWVGAWRPEWRVPNVPIKAPVEEHLPLGKSDERAANMLPHLYEWHRQWRKGSGSP